MDTEIMVINVSSAVISLWLKALQRGWYQRGSAEVSGGYSRVFHCQNDELCFHCSFLSFEKNKNDILITIFTVKSKKERHFLNNKTIHAVPSYTQIAVCALHLMYSLSNGLINNMLSLLPGDGNEICCCIIHGIWFFFFLHYLPLRFHPLQILLLRKQEPHLNTVQHELLIYSI